MRVLGTDYNFSDLHFQQKKKFIYVLQPNVGLVE